MRNSCNKVSSVLYQLSQLVPIWVSGSVQYERVKVLYVGVKVIYMYIPLGKQF